MKFNNTSISSIDEMYYERDYCYKYWYAVLEPKIKLLFAGSSSYDLNEKLFYLKLYYEI